MELKFDITGMTCAACSARVEKVTAKVPGVNKAEVNLLAGKMMVEADSADIADATLAQNMQMPRGFTNRSKPRGK